MSYPKVFIIVLNWNGVIDTLGCLASLSKINYSYFEIVVVDNGSTDDSVKKIRREYPDIEIVETGKNLGYALGNNLGIKYALDHHADYILVLNNDTLVEKDFLTNLMRAATQNKNFSIFSPQIRLYPEKDRLWYAGGRIFWPAASTQLFCRNRKIKCSSIRENKEIDFVTGAAMLVRAETFKKVGGFDRKFFCYFEETDWQARAQNKDTRLMYVPGSIIYHKVARASGGEDNPKVQYYFYRNNLLFAKKNLAPAYFFTFIPFYILRVFVYELLRAIIDLILLKPQRFNNWFYILRGIFDFCRGKFGKVV